MKLQRLLFVLTVLCVSGCSAKVPLRMMLPAETDLSRYRRVAVIPFTGPGGSQLTNSLESTLMNARVNGKPYFTLMSRNELPTVVREIELQQHDYFDEETSAAIGKLKGIDALITGNSNEYAWNDQVEYKTYEVVRDNRTYQETYACVTRTARVHLNVKFIETKSARLELSLPLEGNASDDDCQPRGTQPRVTDPNQLLRQATDTMFAGFAQKIAPHEVTKEVVLRHEDDEIGFFGGGSEPAKAASVQIANGVRFAKAGNWSSAITAWDQAVVSHPNSAAAHYNLGVAYEAQGNLQKASEMYGRAAQLNGDSLYVDATGAIALRIEQDKRVKAQTAGR